MPAPGPPTDLNTRGRDLWRAVHRDYTLSAPEAVLLAEACRTTDELEQLRTALAAAEAVVTGSTGQPVANRLYAELREHRHHLARLLASLDLPADTAATGATPATGLRAVGRARRAG